MLIRLALRHITTNHSSTRTTSRSLRLMSTSDSVPSTSAPVPPTTTSEVTPMEGVVASEEKAASEVTTRPVPDGFTLHTENSTSILFAIPPTTTGETAPVFLNPVQEYNRDLSVVAIRTWSEMRQKDKAAYWEEGVKRKWARKRSKKESGGLEGEKEDGASGKKVKGEDGEAREVQPAAPEATDAVAPAPTAETSTTAAVAPKEEERVLTAPLFKFTLLEALSATGLRAIRYAKEIPLLKYVVANDLSSSAVLDIRRNVEWNDLSPPGLPVASSTEETTTAPTKSKAEIEELTLGKVRVNEGDACVKMYSHRTDQTRFDCIDLDPYGSAVPFLDAAIGAVADGGLMCITCTDMGVLAGHNYPEKSYTHYGGVCVNTEYSHEVALRLVLHSLAQTAARYGRHIEPLLSLSIDFYVRLFIRVATSPKEVKALPTKTSIVYYCHNCQSPHIQPFGRVTEKTSKAGNVNPSYHAPSGPPKGVGEKCGECGGTFKIGGPMWTGPLHSAEFVGNMLSHIQEHSSEFKTAARIEGMLTVAQSEVETPFYFTPTRVASFFHCTSPPLTVVASALLNAGFTISRSHAVAGSLKTNAPRSFVHDIMREWIKLNPVKIDNIKEGNPARVMLAQPRVNEVDLTHHPDVHKAMLSYTSTGADKKGGGEKEKLVRYQINPQANWGPARAAIKGGGKKKEKE